MTTETMQDQLERLYQPPRPLAVAKSLDRIDPHGRRFIELSPFLVIGSVSEAGVDVSPRPQRRRCPAAVGGLREGDRGHLRLEMTGSSAD